MVTKVKRRRIPRQTDRFMEQDNTSSLKKKRGRPPVGVKPLGGEELSTKNRIVDNAKLHSQLVRYNERDQALGRERISSIALLNKSIQAQFKEQAKAFKHVLSDMPELSSTDVIRLCVHLALQKEDFESAARWAKELVEFERPKLSRREVIEKDETEGMTDEELQAALEAEGLISLKTERAKRRMR